MTIPIWALVLLCAGCLPTAVVLIAVLGAFVFRIVDAIGESIREKGGRK